MNPPPVAVVTGSRKGIGRHLAGHLVARGYSVVGCSRQEADWTLAGYEHIVAVLDGVRRRHGGLSVLINNAGVASMNPVLLTPGVTVERIVRTNFLGTV